MESGIFYTISINLCCFNFFLCFFPPVFSKLRQRLEPVEPNSGGIPAWQQLHRRIPGRHPMLWLCGLCLSRPLWLRYAKQLLSGYLVSAGWNRKPIQLTQKNISKTALERLLTQGRPGDIIQYGTPHYPHTMVLLQTITEGFTVYDCNYDRQCTVLVRQVSYEALAAEIGSSSAQCGLTLYRANLKEWFCVIVFVSDYFVLK